MSQGDGYRNPYWDALPPHSNAAYPSPPSLDGNTRHPPLYVDPSGEYGATNANGHFLHSTSMNSHNQPDRNPNRPHHHIRHPPSQYDIDNLQTKIRNMLSDGESPGQQTTLPMSLRGRPSRGLYQSPPLRRTYPPNSPTNRAKSFGRDKPYDSCEDITAYALNVVKNLEIPDDERSEKEEFLKDLEEIVQRIRPTAKVEVFGSFANTFTIANSDIDCCVTDPDSTSDQLQQSGLPEMLQKELDNLGFETTLLTLTRVPILKIYRPPTDSADSSPPKGKVYKYPLHCDVGWQNRLALHNTYLLATYSRLDPRVRQIVLFVKYWTKTRCIARPRWGTLCSYGYVLMILYYLTHVVQPSVLPNLQCLPMRGVARLDEVECEGCNIYFSKDASGWKTQNIDSVGELIKGFFQYFAFEWHFKNNVISIRSIHGMLTKESKGWTTLVESTGSQSQTIKSRYLIAIEDPFELSHNVGRTVNKQGRTDIRGEFIRAAKMLSTPHGRKQWLASVCMERVFPERIPPKRPINGEGDDGIENETVVETVLDSQVMEMVGEVRVALPPVNRVLYD